MGGATVAGREQEGTVVFYNLRSSSSALALIRRKLIGNLRSKFVFNGLFYAEN